MKKNDIQCLNRPPSVASLGLVSALGAKILQLQTDVLGLCEEAGTFEVAT